MTVSGNVDADTLMKKLNKAGKHAELWGAPKANNHHNQLNNQLKNLQLDNGGKGGKQKGGNHGGGGNQPKGGHPNPQQLQQQLQQIKGFQDLKLPQFKDLKMPLKGPGQAPKAVSFNFPEDDGLSDDEFDDEFDDDEYDEFDDELDDIPHHPLDKMKPVVANGQGNQMHNLMMLNEMMNSMNAQALNEKKAAANGGGNGKKGGGGVGGAVPIHGNGHNDGKNGGGKKGGGGGNNGGNQNQGGGKNGGKNGGSVEGKSGGGGGGGNKNSGSGGNGNGGKKGGVNDGVGHAMSNMPNAMHNMAAMRSLAGGNMGQMPMGPIGSMPMGQMGNMPMAQMGNNVSAAVQGLPAGTLNAGGAGGGVPPGYFQGAAPDIMAGNPYYQQQMAAMMMNQQRAHGNERFQPMMYARPPPAVNYMPSYPPPQSDAYTHFFSDENTSSCNVM